MKAPLRHFMIAPRDLGEKKPSCLAGILWLAAFVGLPYVFERLGLANLVGLVGGLLVLCFTVAFSTWTLRTEIYAPGFASLPYLAFMTASVIVAFAWLYQLLGLIGPGEQPTHAVLDSLYFSVITFTTVGYGDFRPTPQARPLAALEALVGYWSLGLLIAAIATRWTRPPQTIPPGVQQYLSSKDQAKPPTNAGAA